MLSIIIPVYNQHKMTQECLKSIYNNTKEGTYEIIIVDNGSNPPLVPTGITTEPYYPNCKIFRNITNLGFPVAINQGINESKGDIIIILNNDTIVLAAFSASCLVANPHLTALSGVL